MQEVSEQAITVPLMVKPVTVSVTGMVCGLPWTIAPPLLVAETVIYPV